MIIEHVGFDVENPVAMAAWYVKHLGLEIVRHIPSPSQTHFLTDSNRKFSVEIYRNASVQTLDYRSMNPLLLHLAFTSEDPVAEKQRLIAAGATFDSEINLPDGSHLIMLRDPWGLPVQLCRRSTPLT